LDYIYSDNGIINNKEETYINIYVYNTNNM